MKIKGIMCGIAFVIIAHAANVSAREGDDNAMGKISGVNNGFLEIEVSGITENGPLWLGCTFYPRTANETDLAPSRPGRNLFKIIPCSGSFTEKYRVPKDLVSFAVDIGDGRSEAEYVAALWRYRVDKTECRKGENGGPCRYCLKNGYHLEGRVDVFPGKWSFKTQGTKRIESEEIQRNQIVAEQQAHVAEQNQQSNEASQRQARLEETQRQAKLMEQQQQASQEAQRQAKLDEQRKREREEVQRQSRQDEQRRQQGELQRLARLEEQRRVEQEAAQQQVRIAEQQREAANKQEKMRQQTETRRNPRISIGAAVRTMNQNRIEIVNVRDGSPAARSGLTPGMVVIAVNYRSISSPSEYLSKNL